ncbi:unnamed protein product [Moneuplotes crassus]|uniref:Kelch motif family protein n=2 Tax=Euplotes crassus TaxID=5936 RepID=A0AAD1U909_EUPCR|nr:unnamed protein product [Moneuplotes crassus]
MNSESSVSSSDKATSENQEEEKHQVNANIKPDEILQNATEENPIPEQILNKWEQLRCIGKLPERRSYHTGISSGSRVFIYGGYDIKEGDMKTMFSIDLSEMSPEWREIEIIGDPPKGISRHSALLWDNKIYCLGGECNNSQLGKFFNIDISDTRMNFAKSTARCTKIITTSPIAPLELDSHTAILYPESDSGDADKMIIFGGYYKSLKSSKTFEYIFEENHWNEIELEVDEESKEKLEEIKQNMNEYDVITDTIMETCTNLPRPRTCHTAVYYKHGMYVFGGSDEANNKLNDLWKFDLKERRWIIINYASQDCEDGQPTKRSGHACCSIGNMMYIFGGLEGITHESNDFYCFNMDKEVWTTIQLKVSNPEDIRPLSNSKDSLMNSQREEKKKSLTKIPNMALYGIDKKNHMKRNISNSRRKEGRNNQFLVDPVPDKEKFSKTFQLSPLYMLKKNVNISKKIKDEEVEVDSPTTLALKSSIFLKNNSKVSQTDSLMKKKQFQQNIDIHKTTRIPMMIPCPRDGATLTACENKLVVFGGDRYQMAFNDVFVFNS